ncbi:PAP2 superfamily C-terminal [Mucilaginibacter pineti]|uniref:PAP2 superfamily C-terminal n=1 Tax=Mucilaginibacter pineti TaxID=1391627 RepID=A0A1G7KRW7_9SPHI|nr:sphingomyelin synthase family protein [Mucilaginibacter pineti]SDF39700.1 PAP2 superfamily C-terminal [Mucilaginibacter pineti]
MSSASLYKLKQNWLNAYDTTLKRIKLLIGTMLIVAIINILPGFFRTIEKRPGVVLNDFILTHLPAYDVSVPIFAIIWGMGILLMVRAFYKPAICSTYIWTLIFVCIARFISLTLVNLDPPVGLIPLVDPLTGFFYGHAAITKDLFFSGHTSTMVLIFLNLEKRTDRIIGFIAALTVMLLLLIQHIHYTMDVLAAPVIVYCLYKLALYLDL